MNRGPSIRARELGNLVAMFAGLLVPQCAWLSFVLDIPFGGERVPLESDGWEKKASFYGVCDSHNAFINVMYIGKELKKYCDGQNSNIKGPPGSTPEAENLFMGWDFTSRIDFCAWYS